MPTPTMPVKLTDPFLADLQANILKFHGRENALHLFIVFKDTGAAREGIRQLVSDGTITTAQKQLADSARRKEDKTFDGGPVVTFSLSGFGYKKLQQEDKIPQVSFTDFVGGGEVKIDGALLAGMKASAGKLFDLPDQWEEGFKADIDAMITIGEDDLKRLEQVVEKIKAVFGACINIVKEQPGTILRNSFGIGIEHFGYADGISQPIYLEDEINKEATLPTDQWSDIGLMEKLLVQDPGGKDGDSFGSFLVFRKLEQNVKAFKDAEKATQVTTVIVNGEGKFLAPVLNDAGTFDDELAGAMIVGRFEDGTEVINASKARDIQQEADLHNNFNYQDDKPPLKCPFHAHTRITNPRGDVGPFAKEVRLTRRGIPYNEANRNVIDLEDNQPVAGVGLLFQCYQESIIAQFEFIQKAWANDGNIGGNIVGQDPIIGQGVNAFKKFLPVQWGNAEGSNEISYSGFVTMKGGEYFFTPSVSFLEGLGSPEIVQKK